MPDLLIKFKLNLEYHPIQSGALYIPHPHGPLFHRWLPDGVADAIELDTNDSKATLKVWFERQGYVDDGYIRFDKNRKEVAPDILSTQGKLDAGPLFGLLEIRDISDIEARSLKERNLYTDVSKNLEKRIILLLQEPVSQFLNILRVRYGQYWIPEIERWDSRKVSAGVYIRSFGFPHWSLDGGQTWDTFQYTELRLSVGELRKKQDFREYLSERDWRDISSLLHSDWSQSQAVSTLIRAIELFDNGQDRYAIVEAVTALEMALSEVARERLLTESLSEYTQPLESLPFIAQLIFGSVIPSRKEKSEAAGQSLRISAKNALSGFHKLDLGERFNVMANLFNVLETDRRATLQIIGIRNEIVHEGKSPPANFLSEFSGFLNCFERLFPNRQFRFPMAGSGNRKMAPQEWENLQNE
jgi:hypothetical protein